MPMGVLPACFSATHERSDDNYRLRATLGVGPDLGPLEEHPELQQQPGEMLTRSSTPQSLPPKPFS